MGLGSVCMIKWGVEPMLSCLMTHAFWGMLSWHYVLNDFSSALFRMQLKQLADVQKRFAPNTVQ